MEFKEMVTKITNESLKENTEFIVEGNSYLFIYEHYKECCDEYGKHTVNEYLDNTEHMEGNGIYEPINVL
tara:strand:- start:1627 stop:1836 length:210 start_codon:yes stop_codon:yes gene_type:complete